jgi:hypothetical protein
MFPTITTMADGPSLLESARAFFAELPPETAHFRVKLLYETVEVEVSTEEATELVERLDQSTDARREASKYVREQKLRKRLAHWPKLLNALDACQLVGLSVGAVSILVQAFLAQSFLVMQGDDNGVAQRTYRFPFCISPRILCKLYCIRLRPCVPMFSPGDLVTIDSQFVFPLEVLVQSPELLLQGPVRVVTKDTTAPAPTGYGLDAYYASSFFVAALGE